MSLNLTKITKNGKLSKRTALSLLAATGTAAVVPLAVQTQPVQQVFADQLKDTNGVPIDSSWTKVSDDGKGNLAYMDGSGQLHFVFKQTTSNVNIDTSYTANVETVNTVIGQLNYIRSLAGLAPVTNVDTTYTQGVINKIPNGQDAMAQHANGNWANGSKFDTGTSNGGYNNQIITFSQGSGNTLTTLMQADLDGQSIGGYGHIQAILANNISKVSVGITNNKNAYIIVDFVESGIPTTDQAKSLGQSTLAKVDNNYLNSNFKEQTWKYDSNGNLVSKNGTATSTTNSGTTTPSGTFPSDDNGGSGVNDGTNGGTQAPNSGSNSSSTNQSSTNSGTQQGQTTGLHTFTDESQISTFSGEDDIDGSATAPTDNSGTQSQASSNTTQSQATSTSDQTQQAQSSGTQQGQTSGLHTFTSESQISTFADEGSIGV